jgi:hypothetical protein
LSYVEPVSGFEPLTVRLQGASQRCLGIAHHGLMCHLAGIIVGLERSMSLGGGPRWLPEWLPGQPGWLPGG